MDSIVEEQRKRVAELLMEVANGNLSIRDALIRTEEWKDLPWTEGPFADAYHSLKHYEIDADIRERDPGYAAQQIAGLRRCAEKLR